MLLTPAILSSTPWARVGPLNIGDDVHNRGEAGTLADAVSPASNPLLMFAGGTNNGASSGVLKTVNGGMHWTLASNGIWDTAIDALHIADDKGDHLYCAVPGAIYESRDAAVSWTLVANSSRFGKCNSFSNGKIHGEPYVLAGCEAGVANVPARGSGQWNLIPTPPGHAAFRSAYMSSSDSNGTLANSVIGGCIWINGIQGGRLHLGKIINTTAAEWEFNSTRPCEMIALNPNDARHMIYSKPFATFQTLDGGKTFEDLNQGSWHVGIDRQGWLYTAGMSTALVTET